MEQPPQYPEGPPAAPGPSTDPSPGPPAPPAPPPRSNPRVLARPEPRTTTALAAAGAALAVTGSFVVSGDALDGSGGDDGSQLPGLLLSTALLVAGLALLARAPGGALRTAGSVASVLAIPAIAFFLTFDEGGFPPFSIEAVLGLSAAGWLLLHAVGPAAGRSFPLTSAVLAAWLFVLQVVEEPFTSPFDIIGELVFAPAIDDGGNGFGTPFDRPDPTTMGVLTLALAALVVWLGHRADRAGAHGRAGALALPPILMVPVGIALLAGELEEAGVGVALFAVGLALSISGGRRGRRGTTWAGALFVYYGAGIVVDDLVGDSTTGVGVGALAAGAAIVALAHGIGGLLDEPDELEPGPAAAAAVRPPIAEF